MCVGASQKEQTAMAENSHFPVPEILDGGTRLDVYLGDCWREKQRREKEGDKSPSPENEWRWRVGVGGL